MGLLTGQAQIFPDIQFSYLTEKDGLSNNKVNWISQDAEGFMWFGTNVGLNRYDGYRIRKFFHIAANENSLNNNCVTRIVSGKKNYIWIGTREGVCVYNKLTGTFRNFKHNSSDTDDLADDGYASIYLDQQEKAWVSTGKGVYEIDSSFRTKKMNVGFTKF